MDKLKMQTADSTMQNIERIAQLFPNCVTEVMKDGKETLAIDFDRLRQELSDHVVEGNDERYQFTWPDKRKAQLAANAPISATLRPCREESVDFDTTGNLYIEGDNLDVLKCLKETYSGKIKVIYIDPPYNTGKDFVYNDDFAESASEYLANSGQFDDQGNRLVTNTESNGRYHTDWLNMIYPRLKVGRDLLTEDGVIFISIDDNEYENLKKVCDEIFGEINYQATLHIQVRYGEKSLNEEKPFKPMIEYILVYSKNSKEFMPNRPAEEYGLNSFIYEVEELSAGTKFNLNGQEVILFKKGEWSVKKHNSGSLNYLKETWISGSVYTNMSYGKVFQRIVEPRVQQDGLGCLYKVIGRGEDGLGYRYYTGPQKATASRGKMYSGVPLDRVEEMRQGKGSLKFKPILCFNDYSADFGNIRHEGGIPFNSGKKPIKMLMELINYHTDKNCIVLDFFSGSASTAHAVMQLNINDGGERNFIMVQIPEQIDSKSELRKLNFETICEIGKERIRRAGKKIKAENPNASALDTGFRVLKLADSNMKDVYYAPADLQQADLFGQAENIKDDRTPEDLLFQVMLELGVLLDSKIEVQPVAGKQIYTVAGGFLIACFDKGVTDEVIIAIAKQHPQYAVLRDSSYADDSTATNFEQVFKTYSPSTTIKTL